METVTITISIFRTLDGRHTCRLDSDNQCIFLGFRKFGCVPVCMKGEQNDLHEYEDTYIKPNCDLVKE